MPCAAFPDARPADGTNAVATLTPKNAANAFFTKTIATRYGIRAGANYVGNRWADPANITVLDQQFTADSLAGAEVGPA